MSTIANLPGSTSEAIAALHRLGYTGSFRATDDGLLCCRTCGVGHDPAHLEVAAVGVRSGDHGLVAMPLRCPCCRARGVAVVPAATGAARVVTPIA